MIPKRRLKFPQPNGLRLTSLKNPPQRRQFPVERSNAGQALNNLPQHCSSRLAAPRCATASGGAVQTLERSALQKVRDVVGLYLDPPDRALVLCVDEKSQIQALDRPAPILPLRPGLPERQTHDYKRHGTTTLFAAFNILNGRVIGTCQPRHRSR